MLTQRPPTRMVTLPTSAEQMRWVAELVQATGCDVDTARDQVASILRKAGVHS